MASMASMASLASAASAGAASAGDEVGGCPHLIDGDLLGLAGFGRYTKTAAGAAGRSRWLLSAAVLVLALPLAACEGTPALGEVRAGIESAMPGIDLVPETNLHFGRFTIGLLHWAAGWGDHEERGADGAGAVEARRDDFDGARLVRAIHRLDLATFRVRAMPRTAADTWSPEMARRFGAAGWSLVVHATEPDEQTWVFFRAGADMTDLYVVSLEGSELCLIRVGGRFDQAMASALARHPKAVRAAAAGQATREETSKAGSPAPLSPAEPAPRVGEPGAPVS